ncbi:MAG: hypothetical protein ACK5SI_14655, partial [Planctomycetia bacterium]
PCGECSRCRPGPWAREIAADPVLAHLNRVALKAAGRHRVAFRHPVRGRFDAGSIDFTTVREVVVNW